MAEKLLLLDIGNSRIKWCHAQDGRLQPASADTGDGAEFERHCRRAEWGLPDAIRVSSVAGAGIFNEAIAICRDACGLEPEILRTRAQRGGVTNGYEDPARLGVDRWLALLGAVARYGKPVVVWDLGTAATLDAVDADGKHLGGWILPGPETMLESLEDQTELPVPEKLDGEEHGAVIPPARDTARAIHQGVYAAQKGALNQFMKNFEPGAAQPRIIVTGGAALPMLEYLEHACIVDPLLVFRGMLVDV
jgi:type III pantothenate kinase